MRDYTSSILKDKSVPPPQEGQPQTARVISGGLKPRKDYASRVLGDPFFESTGQISTVTGDEISRLSPVSEKGASFSTMRKVSEVDDPETKVKIFAEARGIHPKKYRYIDGQAYYQAPDNKWYPEVHPEVLSKAKEFGAGVYGKKGPIIGGTIGGLVGGVPGAMLGASAGEGFRKIKGSIVHDEPQTAFENITNMLEEGIYGATGEALGRIFSGVADKRLIAKGGRLAKEAGRSIDAIDASTVNGIIDMAESFGVELSGPQITEAKRLVDRYSLLRDLPETANIIQDFDVKQAKQVEKALINYFKTLAPERITPYSAGSRIVDAANKSIGELKKTRSRAARPYYEASKLKEADISSVINEIDSISLDLPPAGMAKRSLDKVKKLLTKKTEKVEEGLVIDPATGKPFIGPEAERIISETRIGVLDNAKKEIDTFLRNPETKQGVDADILRRIEKIKKSLVGKMDESSFEYALAREKFGKLSEPVTAAKEGLTGEIAKLKGDKVVTTAKRLFSSITSTPETVSTAKDIIMRQDPDAWNALLRDHLNAKMNKIKSSAKTERRTNLGGRFWADTIGDKQQQDILREAMSKEQFQALLDLTSILRKTGVTVGKESATASRQVEIRELTREGSPLTLRILKFARTMGDSALETVEDLFRGRYNEELAEAMVSPEAAKLLAKMKRLSPRSKQFMENFTRFATLVASGEYALKRKLDEE